MAKVTRAVPEATYPAGSYDFDLNVPGGLTFATLTMTRVNWPGAPGETVAMIQVDLSFDDGQTWQPAVRATLPGGEDPRFPESRIACAFPRQNLGSRRMRGSIQFFQPLTTAITLEAFGPGQA